MSSKLHVKSIMNQNKSSWYSVMYFEICTTKSFLFRKPKPDADNRTVCNTHKVYPSGKSYRLDKFVCSKGKPVFKGTKRIRTHADTLYVF